ncbi:MAG: hypothetical protein ACKV19_29505 [Verrucomicrobiales bacterium]
MNCPMILKAFLWRMASAAVLSVLLATVAHAATWQDAIGYTRLVEEMGGAVPRGAGVSVSLVEASLTPDGGEYLPSANLAPTTGNFAGKLFNVRSDPSPVSFHAVRAGAFFFGVNTNPLAGDASVAPLAGSGPSAAVHCYQADGWLEDNLIRLGSLQPPRFESQAISNHSWIGAVGADFSSAQATETLQRLDWMIVSSDHVAVVGLNNGASTAVPPLLGSAYNILSVGRTDGAHSTGTSSAHVDGPGRVKPELVAPMTATSWSTPVVSSCAAVLVDAGTAVSPSARRSEVIRALLLAGARKDPFPTWTQSSTRPLDPHFGAGEVNIWRSHRVLVAGPVEAGAAEPARRSGWHYTPSMAPGTVRAYPLTVPEGCVARELAVALVWNRQVSLSLPSSWINPQPALANLDLHLVALPTTGTEVETARSESGASGSVPHPIEYLHQRHAPAGRYDLRVVNAPAESSETSYGLAWFLDLGPALPPEIASQWSADAQSLTLTFSRLGVGLTYTLESSDNLLNWTPLQSITASTPTATLVLTGPPARAFYRLVWAE